ncbi:spike base protein, RCAP_Rcc01079 family [Jannaschia seohaensis]|uniref:Uncharacterized protein n=1 Tax=Jannaschia seohaensis TaxID=475081 RepID=A0A2Y9B5A5_9RHOB|nr:hypothetical protein [Jannaschia seohaensis]PWJ12890.1 hypothetical protein BCF38_11526 [Jannaschia seohaensis]SSA50698.1 hypothetical protein SAMN05421539_11526 [Jannaschia seohaensis]
MTDKFSKHVTGLDSPASALQAVTPDDATDLPLASRAIAVAQAGDVRVTTVDGSIATIYVAAGMPFPVRVARIWATGTTATGIVALS